jgi:transcriptional regulator with XRE-family HTH domain
MNKRNLIGERVRIARNNLSPKLTQLELSARLQVQGVMIGDSTIGKIENHTSAVTDIQLVALSQALNVSVLWLLGLEE